MVEVEVEVAQQPEGFLLVRPARGPVWRMVTLLGLERRWPVHHDVARAAAALGRQR